MSVDRLRTLMRAEAEAGSPAFSRLLHERIMGKLRAVEVVRVERRGGRAWWGYAAAASVLVAGSYLVFSVYYPRRVGPTMTQLPSPADISAPVDRILTSAAAPAVQTMDEGRYGYLDHDAKNFVTFLASQFPGAPGVESSPRK